MRVEIYFEEDLIEIYEEMKKAIGKVPVAIDKLRSGLTLFFDTDVSDAETQKIEKIIKTKFPHFKFKGKKESKK